MRRPRIRSADDRRELPVETYEYSANRHPLTRAVMDRMLAGVSTRRFARVGEPVGEGVERSSSTTSKTSVSGITGYRDLATLVIAIERHALLTAPPRLNRKETAELVTV